MMVRTKLKLEPEELPEACDDKRTPLQNKQRHIR